MIRAAWVALALAGAASAQTPAYQGYALPGHAAPEAVRVEIPRLGAVPDTTAPPDAWLGRDKALHAGGSLLLTLSGQYLLVDKAGLSNAEALPVAAGTTLLLGVMKEVTDSRRTRHPLFSWRDLAADAAGIAVAAALVSL
ncbi:MAG: hypothetical protein AAF845_05470 [Bacteroidota bacterium]